MKDSPSRRERVERGIYSRTAANGRRVFEIGFRDAQSKQRWRRIDGGITAARRALADAHAARGRGEKVAPDPRLRFGDAAQAWWDARAVRLRPTTQAVYRSCLAHLNERFARARLVDIRPADVARFVVDQQTAGLKGWTIKGQLTVLNAVYRYASRHLGYVGTSPVALLDRFERPSGEDERPKRVLTAEELSRLLAAVDEPYRLIFELAAETGARLGEALGLVWGEIGLEARTVTFTHQLSSGQREALKTKRSRRCIGITPGLAAKLAAAKLAAWASGDHDYVFVTRTGTPHDHRNVGGRVLARAVTRAGLEAIEREGRVIAPAPTFHNLRHSHGSALIAAGWDIEEVSARLGHSNVGTTQRAYVHAYDAARRSEHRRERLATLYADDDQAQDERVRPLAVASQGTISRSSTRRAPTGALDRCGRSAGTDARDRDLVEDVRRRDGAVWVASQAGLKFRAAGGGAECLDRVPLGDVDEGGAASDPAMQLRRFRPGCRFMNSPSAVQACMNASTSSGATWMVFMNTIGPPDSPSWWANGTRSSSSRNWTMLPPLRVWLAGALCSWRGQACRR
jgi:integrase